MSDTRPLVERLRDPELEDKDGALLEEAADEIERLLIEASDLAMMRRVALDALDRGETTIPSAFVAYVSRRRVPDDVLREHLERLAALPGADPLFKEALDGLAK